MSDASVTLSEVARRANVHPSTVSKAMRNHPRLSAATRDRLRKLAEEMGYRPDPQLAVLNAYRHGRRSSRRGTLALLHPPDPVHPEEARHTNTGFWSDTVRHADRLGFSVDAFDLNDPDLSAARLHQILQTRNIRGCVVNGRTDRYFRIDLPWAHYAAVTTGFHLVEPTLDVVSTDHFRNTQRAFGILWERGCRRIGLIADPLGEEVTHRRRAGAFFAESDRLGNPVRPFHGKLTERDAFLRWFEAEKPDALLASDLGRKRRMEALGLRFPRDAALVLLNLRREGVGEAAGIQQNMRGATRTAVELVAAALQNGRLGPPEQQHFHLIEGHWHEGPTLPVAP